MPAKNYEAPITLHSILDIFQFALFAFENVTYVPLHSILDIFQWRELETRSICNTLYIPFWIYSNYKYTTLDHHIVELYIPFWIYSNENFESLVYVLCSFTFHSGYIPIKEHVERVVKIKNFTFHSGYIPMFIVSPTGPMLIASLHSILDIFQ